MIKIVVIGGGFAGISALERFSKKFQHLDITLIDKKSKFDFLPLLPDLIGAKVSPSGLSFDLANFCQKAGIRFVNSEISRIDLVNKAVSFDSRSLSYDYLLIASGTHTNFYDNQTVEKISFKLESIQDALKIQDGLERGCFENFIVAGGGYTGIEVATNIKRYCRKQKIEKPIVIVEKSPSILGALPEWMRQYAHVNLKSLGIEIFLNDSISQVSGSSIRFSSGRIFENSMLIWVAGVVGEKYIHGSGLENNLQGRLKADYFLRVFEGCFVAGDAGCFPVKGNCLRMAVQFSIVQGRLAAENILHSIKGEGLVKYRPLDFGYVIPMIDSKACGFALGLPVRGIFAISLHYLMCFYLSKGLANKIRLLRDLLKGGVR
ncbi:MAG: FAD-dependent oxidoreductase [Candidatus Omnitrophota bacterium]